MRTLLHALVLPLHLPRQCFNPLIMQARVCHVTTSITPCAAALILPFRCLPAGLPSPSETWAECKRHLTRAAQRVTLFSGMKTARVWQVTDKKPSNGEHFVFVPVADRASVSDAAALAARRSSVCVCVRRVGGGECEPGCLLDAPYFIYSVPACVTLCGVARAGMPLQPHRATTSQRRRSEDWACDARAPGNDVDDGAHRLL